MLARIVESRRAIMAEEKAHLRVKLSTLIPQDDNQVRPSQREGKRRRKEVERTGRGHGFK
jgi:hypothetical protein